MRNPKNKSNRMHPQIKAVRTAAVRFNDWYSRSHGLAPKVMSAKQARFVLDERKKYIRRAEERVIALRQTKEFSRAKG